jgi:hypothetical protein
MKSRREVTRALFVALLSLILGAVVALAPATAAAKPAWTENCTKLNKKYPHGVGKRSARDKTSGTPVTNFKKSNRLYRTAMKHNKGLDRDKDGIACEQA